MNTQPYTTTLRPFPSSQLAALETTRQTFTPPCLLGNTPAPTWAEPNPDEIEADAGVSFRHSGWLPNRNAVRRALETLEGAETRLARFDRCGEHAWVLQSVDDPTHYRVACNKCRDRFCTPCSRDRARHVADCVAIFAKDRELRLITLTLRQTTATMKQDIDRLYRCFARMRRLKGWTTTQRGGVYLCEVKRRRADDGWHTHMHILSEGVWLCDKWLSKTWHRITGDSFKIDIRECESTAKAARYVAKYASKGVHGSCYHDPLILLEAMMAIRGRRLVGKYGTWSELDLKSAEATGEWLPVDSLDRLVRRSVAGDRQATRVLNCLRGLSCPDTERSPPLAPGPLQSA